MASVTALVSAAAPYILGVSAGAQVLSGIAGQSQANQQAAAYNDAADAAMAQAKNKSDQEREKYRRLAESQKAQFGASGVDVNSGSPLDVLADTDAEGATSAMQLLYGGELEAWNQRNKAYAARQQGQSSLLGGIMGGVSTGLLGASKLGLLKPAAETTKGLGLVKDIGKPLYSSAIAGLYK
jgi:hypothetical protein